MASTFTILQAGKEELVTAYIDSSSSYLNGSWWECGIYELPIKAKTNSGNSPTFNWFQYVDIEILDNLLAQYPLSVAIIVNILPSV